MTTDDSTRRPAVLYVDDEPAALKYFSRMFGDEFEVLTASTAADAREVLLARGDDIGLVITDQRMPGESGVSLLEYARVRYPSALRILTTAYTDLQSAIAAVNSGGAYQYVEKPWNFDELRITLRRAIEHYDVIRERDRLLAQKATALQGSLAVDRTRSLAAVAVLLAEDFDRPLAALLAYLRDARTVARSAFENRELSSPDLWSIAHREGPETVAAIGDIRRLLHDLRGPDPPEPLQDCLRRAVEQASARWGGEGVSFHFDGNAVVDLPIPRPRRLERLIAILAARLSDADGDELSVRVSVESEAGTTKVTLVARDRRWTAEQTAALYSLALTRQGRLLGRDMDLFAAYVLAADLAASLASPRPDTEPVGFTLKFATPDSDDAASVVERLFEEASAFAEPLEVPSAD